MSGCMTKAIAMMELPAAVCTTLPAMGRSVALAVEPEQHAPMSAAAVAGDTVTRQEGEAHFSNVTEPVAERSGDQVVVAFSDMQSGHEYRYTFTEESGRHRGAVKLSDMTTSTGWMLNRAKTDKLSLDGVDWAGIYATAAGNPGGLPAVVGAAIEGAWSTRPAKYYGHGNCIKIHYWLSVSEIDYGSRGCW